ncbi:MAG: cyclic nucleotide-binding domain-containing protein [Bradymonadia bacterium]
MEIRGYSASAASADGATSEDSVLNDEAGRLFIVADGMGGATAGNIASQAAIELVKSFLEDHRADIAAFEAGNNTRQDMLNLLEQAVQQASQAVFTMAQSNAQQRGMGTTLSLLLLTKKRGFIAHVGNSRIYILRQSEVIQLTEDHSLSAELVRQGRMTASQVAVAQKTDSVTRALGVYAHVQVDTFDFELAAGDSFLLATRGIWASVNSTQEISDLVEAKGYEHAPAAFINLRNARNHSEDATALLVRVIASRGEMDAPHSDDLSLKLKLLKQIPLFKHLSYVQLVAVLNVSEVRAYPAGTHIFQEGQMGEELYVVLDGKVGIEKNGTELAKLGAGALFGEMAIMDKAPRSALAVATEDTRLIEVGRNRLFALMRQEKDIAVKLLWCFVQVLNQRLRTTNLDLMKLRESNQAELTAFEES